MFGESIANQDATVEADTKLGELLSLLHCDPGLMVTNHGEVLGGLSREQLFQTWRVGVLNRTPS